MAERTVQIIMRKVWKLSIRKTNSWDRHIVAATKGYNVSFQRVMNAAPVTILTGCSPHQLKLAVKSRVISDAARDFQGKRAQFMVCRSDEVFSRNATVNVKDFICGDKVFRKANCADKVRNGKGCPLFFGPYEVVKKGRFEQYKIRDSSGKEFIVNRRSLKPASDQVAGICRALS